MISTDTAVGTGTGLALTCSRDDLVARLSVVGRAVSARATVQILTGILLSAEAGELSLAATDMELSLRASLPAEVDGDGAVVVPGRLLVELARLLPDERVTIEHRSHEGRLRVACGAASYELNTYSPEDFPKLPSAAGETSSLPRGPLLETVSRVSRSASRDESRPVLTGILVRFEAGKVVMAATDSYRLSVKETPLDGGPVEVEAIIPSRALGELSRLAQAADTVELALLENHAVFHVDDVTLTTRRIDGQFPNYRQLLPETFEHEVVLPRGEFLDVVRRVSVLVQRNSPLRLRFAEGELTVSAQTQDVGEARETMPIAFSGEPLEMGFNAEFLREGIESLVEDEIKLRLISPLRPGLIQSTAGDFWYLIMPIRLAG